MYSILFAKQQGADRSEPTSEYFGADEFSLTLDHPDLSTRPCKNRRAISTGTSIQSTSLPEVFHRYH